MENIHIILMVLLKVDVLDYVYTIRTIMSGMIAYILLSPLFHGLLHGSAPMNFGKLPGSGYTLKQKILRDLQ